jgi:hypothetical protein
MRLRTVCIVLLLCACLPLFAQEFRATISGSITDPTDAPIGGAKITATNLDRNAITESESTGAGVYTIGPLLPGRYNLTAEKAGFKKYVKEGLSLSTADRVGLNIRLELGAVAESVTVTGEASLLQTETASRSSLIQNRAIEDIPTNGRNLYQLQYTLPGVVKTSRYWGSMELYAFGNVNGVMISGGRQGENETLVDGQSNTKGDRGVAWVPSLNSIQEFTIQTNTYDAAYGRVGGGVTSVTLKAGGNAFHGQLFEFLKNDKLRANDWADNTFPSALDANGKAVRTPFKQSTFGFAFDGPVYIPKVFDGRNKLFFLLTLEGLRERNPGSMVTTLPQPEQLTGDFSKLLNSSGTLVTIYDPTSTALDAAGKYVRTPFSGNRIPSNRINPISAKVASFYPSPTNPGSGPDKTENYSKVLPATNGYDAWLGKMDYRVSDKSTVSGRYAQTPWGNFAKIVWGTNAAEPSGEAPSTRVSRNWGVDWTYTLNPTMVFNLRGGLARYEGFSGNIYAAGYDPKTLGFPSSLVSQFTTLQFPRFNIGGLYSPIGADRVTSYSTQDTWTLQPALSHNIGKHMLKYGAEFRRYNRISVGPGAASGTYGFSKAWTQADPLRADAASGNEFASFLLGYPASGNVPINIDPFYRNHYYALYIQDDFKITSKLTLNLGLRWDYETPNYERYDRMLRRFDATAASPIASKVTGLTLKGAPLYAGVGGESRYAFDPKRTGFQPRIGLAYRLAPKWVLRAGYGLSRLGQEGWGTAYGYSQTTSLIASTDGGLKPAVSLSDPYPTSLFPNGLLKPVGNSLGASTQLGLGLVANYADRDLPYSQQYSVGFQRELPGNWLIDASYVGNTTKRLPVGLGQNFLPVSVLESQPVASRPSYFTGQVPNPMAGLLLAGSGINGANVPRQQLLYAYPQYNGISLGSVPIGWQRSDQAQFKATRRFSKGWSSQVAYTIAKTFERANLLNAQDVSLGNLTESVLEKRLAQWDTPQSLAVVNTFDIPIGKGKWIGGDMNKWLNGVVGGWNLNYQWMRQAGFPVDFPNAAPITPGTARYTDAQRNANAQAAGRPQWDVQFDKFFNTTLFPKTAQAPYTLRNFPTRFPDVRTKHMDASEISVYKEFGLYERMRMQIRADWQNAFNHPFFNQMQSVDVTNSKFGQVQPDMKNDVKMVVLVMKIIW